MGLVALGLGTAGAGLCAALFFMGTAFGGGGMVAPGKPPLSPAVGAYLTLSLLAGPVLCAACGIVPWILRWTGSAPHWAWFVAAPALLLLQFAVIFRLMSR